MIILNSGDFQIDFGMLILNNEECQMEKVNEKTK